MTITIPTPANNSEVIKRFGRREIMWRAHGMMKRRAHGIHSFADALRSAWRSLRLQIDREREALARRAERSRRFGSHKPAQAYGRSSYAYQTTVIGA